ncbi:MAG: aldose 1-epimerase [Hyphomicrobiales bacterium]
MLNLTAGDAKLRLHPEMGGGIAGLWVGDKPILRPWSGKEEDGPFALASNILVPFSNRIDGGFTFEDMYHPMAKNMDADPLAIHGDGFQKDWAVVSADENEAVLHLSNGAFGPFAYEARQTFSLTGDTLTNTLTMTNRAAIALPFGGGFHPWFPRTEETRLQASAPDHWPEGEGSLPATASPQPPPDDFDFSDGKPLPDRWINCAFSNWDGKARISQGEGAVSVSLTSETLTTAIIYSPEPNCGFFCFEPVSHPVNAHNLPGMPGLKVLQPGESLAFEMSLDWGAA